jgi:gentisate 1,2-dioxygenase
VTEPGAQQRPNRLGRLIDLRDQQRARYSAGQSVVRGRDLPWEDNELGRQKWYMHPDMTENSLSSLLFWVQEIPPAGRSGRLHYQGGTVGYVWVGRGYTLIDDERYDWAAGDVLNLPVRTDGITVQHVNLDEDEPARLVLTEPDLVQALGVDRGCGFHVLAEGEEPPKPDVDTALRRD